MYATVASVSVVGLTAHPVQVEVDIADGLPVFTIVGLPDATVQEARERVKSAIRNAGFRFPAHRITVNLAPADLRNEGAFFDLPVAIGILKASGQFEAPLDGYEFTDEHIAVERSLELTGCLEDANGHGEVEERAFLAKIRRREVHRDTVSRKAEAGIPDGALDAFASLLDSCIREPHDGEHGQAVGDVDLDLHGVSRQADNTNTRYCCVHRLRVVPESP